MVHATHHENQFLLDSQVAKHLNIGGVDTTWVQIAVKGLLNSLQPYPPLSTVISVSSVGMWADSPSC